MLNPDEIASAAAYFAALPAACYIHVREAVTIPKAHMAGFVGRFDPAAGSETLGQRIVEGPDDFARFEARDPRTAYTAYVPPGWRGYGLAQDATAATIAAPRQSPASHANRQAISRVSCSLFAAEPATIPPPRRCGRWPPRYAMTILSRWPRIWQPAKNRQAATGA